MSLLSPGRNELRFRYSPMSTCTQLFPATKLLQLKELLSIQFLLFLPLLRCRPCPSRLTANADTCEVAPSLSIVTERFLKHKLRITLKKFELRVLSLCRGQIVKWVIVRVPSLDGVVRPKVFKHCCPPSILLYSYPPWYTVLFQKAM